MCECERGFLPRERASQAPARGSIRHARMLRSTAAAHFDAAVTCLRARHHPTVALTHCAERARPRLSGDCARNGFYEFRCVGLCESLSNALPHDGEPGLPKFAPIRARSCPPKPVCCPRVRPVSLLWQAVEHYATGRARGRAAQAGPPRSMCATARARHAPCSRASLRPRIARELLAPWAAVHLPPHAIQTRAPAS